jgi:hypothetical protein
LGVNKDVVWVNIDSLVLEGFTIEDGERIKRAVERELSRLLTEQGVPESYGRAHGANNLHGGQIAVRQNSGASSMGERITRTIYRGMTE